MLSITIHELSSFSAAFSQTICSVVIDNKASLIIIYYRHSIATNLTMTLIICNSILQTKVNIKIVQYIVPSCKQYVYYHDLVRMSTKQTIARVAQWLQYTKE